MSAENRPIEFDPTQKSKSGKNVDYFDGHKSVSNLAAGDSFYIADFIKSGAEKEEIFKALLSEVEFEQMFNFLKKQVEPIPRMIAAQTDKDSEETPIYRMPGCNESNIPTKQWTPTVKKIVELASAEVGQRLNHGVITLYRNSDDSLAFHQDKVLDLEDKSLILSISFGAARPIVFAPASSKSRFQKEQTLVLQPGSLLAMGPLTNKEYKHAIPKLRDSPGMGPRISLSLRTIATFVAGQEKVIVGKGSEFQCRNYPHIKSHDDESEYTDAIRDQIAKYREESKAGLQQLIKNIVGEEK